MKKLVFLLLIINSAFICFITSQNINFKCGDNIKDSRDGIIYKTVQIGTQCWFKENLKASKYYNEKTIPNVKDSFKWVQMNSRAYCNYDNEENNSLTYGHLYNWFAVNDISNLCPNSWHVPNRFEWDALLDYLGGDTVAEPKLKEANINGWSDNNSNSSGFSALPSGCRQGLQPYNSFFGKDYITCFWSSSEHSDKSNAFAFYLEYCNLIGTYYDIYNKNNGYSIRCIYDFPASINDRFDKNNINILIYPNPATDNITIDLEGLGIKNMEIIITNITGQEICKTTTAGQPKTTISTANFPAGIYFARIIAPNFTTSRKFIVAK